MGNEALEMSGNEAKNDSTPTRIDDGSWLKEAPDWIKANFHVRITEVDEDDLVYNSKVDARALTVVAEKQGDSFYTNVLECN